MQDEHVLLRSDGREGGRREGEVREVKTNEEQHDREEEGISGKQQLCGLWEGRADCLMRACGGQRRRSFLSCTKYCWVPTDPPALVSEKK